MTFGLITVFACLVVGAFHFLFRRLLSFQKAPHSPEDILQAPFSPERYFVMNRLLDHLDEEFLISQAGCSRQMRRRHRSLRVATFRKYLRMLSEDFNRICQAIKLHAISAEADRSELTVFVLKEQFRFAQNMASVEFKLAMYSFGWSGVDARALIAPLNMMRDRLQVLAAIPQPMAA